MAGLLQLNHVHSGSEKKPVCRVCARATSKYCCPKCEVPYCSVDCYKNHGEECTEVFYQTHTVAEQNLRSKEDLEGNRSKVIHALKSFSQTGEELSETESSGRDEDDDAFDLLESILHKQNGEFDSLEHLSDALDEMDLSIFLTARQLERFHMDIQKDSAIVPITPWEPFWMLDWDAYESLFKKKSIVELDTGPSKQNETFDLNLPMLYRQTIVSVPKYSSTVDEIPPLHTIFSGSVSPVLPFHLCSVAFAYAVSMRLYNGIDTTREESILEAGLFAIDICGVLDHSRKHSPATVTEVVDNHGMNLIASSSLSFVAAYSDLARLFGDSKMLITALLDLWCLLKCSASVGKSLSTKIEARKLSQASRKVWFFLLWVHDNRQIVPVVEAQVVDYYQLLLHERNDKRTTKTSPLSNIAVETAKPTNTSILPNRVCLADH